jgi:hypothetical protein
MSQLREFVADVMERRGAVVEAIEGDMLEVLAPPPVRDAMGWPELARLGFGAERTGSAIPIGLEGDWLERFGALLGADGRWSARALSVASTAAPGDPERVIERALELQNAVWRLKGMSAAVTRLLVLTFRYTAVSDEKREGLAWVGLNLGTGAVINDLLPRLRDTLALTPDWEAPDAALRAAAPGWPAATLQARLRPLVEHEVHAAIAPFLRTMRRRLERDRNRIHGYHDDLRGAALKRLAAAARGAGERAEAERRRETLRVEAIEREYHAKLDDLRHNYALRVATEWVQALELTAPVQRLELLIRRRKGERTIALDWHPWAKAAEAALCEAGAGAGRARLVCDDNLHLTEPAAQGPCRSCGKPFCRACSPTACPRCGAPSAVEAMPQPAGH